MNGTTGRPTALQLALSGLSVTILLVASACSPGPSRSGSLDGRPAVPASATLPALTTKVRTDSATFLSNAGEPLVAFVRLSRPIAKEIDARRCRSVIAELQRETGSPVALLELNQQVPDEVLRSILDGQIRVSESILADCIGSRDSATLRADFAFGVIVTDRRLKEIGR